MLLLLQLLLSCLSWLKTRLSVPVAPAVVCGSPQPSLLSLFALLLVFLLLHRAYSEPIIRLFVVVRGGSDMSPHSCTS